MRGELKVCDGGQKAYPRVFHNWSFPAKTGNRGLPRRLMEGRQKQATLNDTLEEGRKVGTGGRGSRGSKTLKKKDRRRRYTHGRFGDGAHDG